MKFVPGFKRRHTRAFQVILVLSGILVSFAPSLRSQQPSSPAGGAAKPNFSGVWDKPGASENPAFAGGGGAKFLQREDASMTPWGTEQFQANRKGQTNPRGPANQTLDPSRWCYPPGPARIMSGPQAFEIRHLPDVLLILFERDHWIRRIHTDGREHPEGFPITWMGHAVGKWDGDTLVAETILINPKTWLDILGHPQSDEMRMVERFRLSNPKTLHIDTTYHDPKAYTKPWTEKKTYELMPKSYEILEHVECEEWLEVGSTQKLPPKPI